MMKVVRTASDIGDIEKGCVLTIGNFDGVHIGHQQILLRARQIADERKKPLVVMTFEPHPVAVLHPENSPAVLTPLELKGALLAELGVDYLYVLADSRDFLSISPAEFVERFMAGAIKPAVVVEGEDFNFGSGRAGDIHTLDNLGRRNGFEVVVVEARTAMLSIGKSVRISSTLIRNMLIEGKIADVSAALGRPYRLLGVIVPGKGKGKKLGFPTLNLRTENQIIPAEGVYAGLVEIGDSRQDVCRIGDRMPAAFSIGTSQTYGGSNPLLIEAHLLRKEAGDLYGKWMAMDFIEYIRPQHKFESEKRLAEQIGKDCDEAEEILKGRNQK